MEQSLRLDIGKVDQFHSNHEGLSTVLSCWFASRQLQLGFVPSWFLCWRLARLFLKGGVMCIFGSRSFVPISWMCRKQNSSFSQQHRSRNNLFGRRTVHGKLASFDSLGTDLGNLGFIEGAPAHLIVFLIVQTSVLTATCGSKLEELPRRWLCTMRALLNSNNFGRYGNYFADSNSNFVVVDTISKKKNVFLCVRGSITYNATVDVHVLWLVFTHVLIRCRHTDRHTNNIHSIIPTVVVSLLTHDNMYVYIYMYMYRCMYMDMDMDIWMYGFMDMCMGMQVLTMVALIVSFMFAR